MVRAVSWTDCDVQWMWQWWASCVICIYHQSFLCTCCFLQRFAGCRDIAIYSCNIRRTWSFFISDPAWNAKNYYFWPRFRSTGLLQIYLRVRVSCRIHLGSSFTLIVWSCNVLIFTRLLWERSRTELWGYDWNSQVDTVGDSNIDPSWLTRLSRPKAHTIDLAAQGLWTGFNKLLMCMWNIASLMCQQTRKHTEIPYLPPYAGREQDIQILQLVEFLHLALRFLAFDPVHSDRDIPVSDALFIDKHWRSKNWPLERSSNIPAIT